jgi:hypothetical protein
MTTPNDAETKSRRPRRERSDQQVRRGRVGPAKMVLAEEYSFEAKCFVTNPQVEIAREQLCHMVWVRLDIWSAEFRHKFKYPWFDHRQRLPSAGQGVIARLDTRQAF